MAELCIVTRCRELLASYRCGKHLGMLENFPGEQHEDCVLREISSALQSVQCRSSSDSTMQHQSATPPACCICCPQRRFRDEKVSLRSNSVHAHVSAAPITKACCMINYTNGTNPRYQKHSVSTLLGTPIRNNCCAIKSTSILPMMKCHRGVK